VVSVGVFAFPAAASSREALVYTHVVNAVRSRWLHDEIGPEKEQPTARNCSRKGGDHDLHETGSSRTRTGSVRV